MLEQFLQMPASLKAASRWERLTDADIPVMLVHPDWPPPGSAPATGSPPDSSPGTAAAPNPVPAVIWMHGRTVKKETDPGRFLRWLRAGIGACTIDLPGHGERFDDHLQHPDHAYELIQQMHDELDNVVGALGELGVFDMNRLAIGGMSAGGMVTLARLCRPHNFRCACVEATSGSWRHQQQRPMFAPRAFEAIASLNPMDRLDDWREIPLQAIHSRPDEWVAFEGQLAFIDAIRHRYEDPSLIEFIAYDETGAPYEHAGFGRLSSDAKNRQIDFLKRFLI